MALRDRIATRAANAYRPSGRSAYYFARFKLSHDPFYTILLSENLVPAGAHILDLGCAQGLLAAWLAAARQCHAEGEWDGAIPTPQPIASYRGVDRNAAEIRRARAALDGSAEFVVGDILAERPMAATLIVLLDVLHYLDYSAQLNLLRLVRNTLPAGGCLLLRVGDRDAGVPALVSGWIDRLVLRLRIGGKAELCRRSLKEWLLVLKELGFTVEEIARQRSMGYSNSLLRALPPCR